MKNNIFQKARIKLTFYYIGIMAVILLAFSSVLIFTIESRIRDGFKDHIIVTELDSDPIKDTSNEIEFLIYTIDGILLLVIGFLSYFLAGKTLKPIKEALESQKKFSADASHDLRTPLAIMTTESEVTLQNKNSTMAELRNTIESNLEETIKMSKLVNDLLLISRGENQVMLYSFTEVDLHNFIDGLIKKVTYQVKNKGLSIHLCEYKKILISFDTNNFERAILNILQNAIKYTKIGTVTIGIQEENNKAIITISDTGIGIAEKDLPYVFNRFYRVEHSRSDSTGSGLGLPIAQLIIKEHKGDIDIKSTVNQGTTVTIKLPRN